MEPTPVFLPGESHRQRRLVRGIAKGWTWLKRLSTYTHTHTHTHVHVQGRKSWAQGGMLKGWVLDFFTYDSVSYTKLFPHSKLATCSQENFWYKLLGILKQPYTTVTTNVLLQACQLFVEIMVWSSVLVSEPWAIALTSFGNLLVMLSDSTPGQWDKNVWEWSLVFCILTRQFLSTSKFEVQWCEYCLSFRHKAMMAVRLPAKHQKKKEKMLVISWRS